MSRPSIVTKRALLMVLSAWAAALVLHQIDVGGSWMPVHSGTWFRIAAWLGCFTLAFAAMLGHLNRTPIRAAAPLDSRWAQQVIAFLALVAALGAILIMYDFVVLRGYGFSTSVDAIRAEEGMAVLQGRGGSAISGAGRLMLPALIPAFIFAALKWRAVSRPVRLILAGCSVVVLGEQLFFEGGRFFITSLFGSVLITYFMRPNEGRQLARRRIPYVRIAIAGALLFSFFSYVFVDRILARGDFFWSAYLGFSRDFLIVVDPATVGRFEGPFGALWFSICMLWLYFTQGFNELDQVLGVNYFAHAYGLFQIPHASPIAGILFGAEIRYDLVANLPNVGTYITFYGANYVDFGDFGALLSALLLASLTARSLLGFASGRTDGVSLMAPMLFVLCLFTPVVSLLTTLWPALLWTLGVGMAAPKRNA